MPREKHSMPDDTDTVESVALVDEAQQKTKSVSAKVTLVKPVQPEAVASDDKDGGAKLETRPKVGRTGAQRKKKNKEEAESSAKAEAASKPVWETAPVAPEKKIVSEAIVEPESEPLRIEQLREQLRQTEMATEWENEQTRPWSVKSILTVAILFVAINVGFMTLFSINHKSRIVTQAPEASQTTVADKSASAPAAVAPAPVPPPPVAAASAAAVPQQVAVSSPALVVEQKPAAPVPQAAADESYQPPVSAAEQAAAARAKASDQRELFDILNRD